MESYPKPPITEALFDIQVVPRADLSPKDLEGLADRVAQKYPTKKPRRRFEGRFELKQGELGKTQTVDLGVDGFLCWNSEKTQVLQFRLDGFGSSRLKPYQGWESAFSEVCEYWPQYCEIAKPSSIKKIVVRYINNIGVPAKKFELNDYLKLAPQIPDIKGAEIHGFLTQVVFQVPEKGARAVLIQMIAQNPDPIVTPLILDLEIGIDVNRWLEPDALMQIFSELRSLKNEIFKKCVTEKAEEGFR